MFHITEAVSRIGSSVGALLDRADRALCARQDERARAHGWTVARTGFGARRYRDPRFDALKAAAARTGEAAGATRVAGMAGAPGASVAPRSGSWT